MDQDTRDELDAVQRRWLAGVAELRQERQGAVMRALAKGNSKYAIAQALHVAGPTVDAIIKTAEREPPAPAPAPAPAERPARQRRAQPVASEPETSLRPAAGSVPFREPEPEPACRHPIGMRNGDMCGACYQTVKKR